MANNKYITFNLGGQGGSGSGTELSPVMEFPAGAIPGTVVSYAGSSSAAGVYQYDGTDWIPVGVDDLSAYWTSAQTQAYVEDKELPIAAAVNELKGNMEARLDQQYYKKQEVNNLLNEKVTAGQVNEQIKDYTDPAIAEVYDTIEDKELPVSAALNELNEKVNEISGNTGGGGDMSAYWTSAETKTYVDTNLGELSGVVQEQQIVFSSGYNELHTQVLELSASTANMVTSTSVSSIWKGTQSEYDTLTESGATANPNTFYIIINN